MTIAQLGMIVFFLAFGISVFYPFPYSLAVEGIAALITGVALILKK